MLEAKKLDINGLEINYYEQGEGDTTLFLIHGNSGSARSYIHQLEGLSDAYHVIAMDLPGHGLSGKAQEPQSTYNMPGYAAVVVAVAEKLDATDAVFVGWSLGGHIVLEAVPSLPDAAGFVIFGTPPVGFPMAENAFLPTDKVAIGFTPELSKEQMQGYVSSFFAPGFVDSMDDLPEAFMEDIAATDGMARASLGMSLTPDGFADEVAIVAEMKQPLAILHGAEEQLVNVEYIAGLDMPTLWKGEVQIIDGAGHAPHFETPDKFNALLTAFAEDIA